jgi:uncharacterized membrane protein YeaQ/YmgE (transglycosylase-associated protein family)
MSLIVTLLVGGIVGWIAAQIAGRDEGLIGSVVIGLVGAVIGSVLAQLFGSGQTSYLTFSWVGFVWSLIGSVLLVAILNAVQFRSHRSV